LQFLTNRFSSTREQGIVKAKYSSANFKIKAMSIKTTEVYFLKYKKQNNLAIKLHKQLYNNRFIIYDFKAKAKILDIKVRKDMINKFLNDKNFSLYNTETVKKNLKKCGLGEAFQLSAFAHEQLKLEQME